MPMIIIWLLHDLVEANSELHPPGHVGGQREIESHPGVGLAVWPLDQELSAALLGGGSRVQHLPRLQLVEQRVCIACLGLKA